MDATPPNLELDARRAWLAEERAAWLEAARSACARLPRTASGRAVARTLTRHIDGLVARLWARQPAVPCPVALYALGGYAREELSPHSDVDLLLLYEGDPEAVAPLADGIRTDLHDIGLRVGFVARTDDENRAMIAADVTAATSLLDARLVCSAGFAEPPAALREVTRAALRALGESDLIAALVAGSEARHARFGDSVYLLEPNLKMGRGGMRDLQSAAWMAAVLFDLPRLGALGARAVPGISRPEAHRVLEAYDFILVVRHLLHQHCGWKNDRLTFAEQEALAARLGFADTHRSLGVERLMGAFYRHAHTLEQRTRRWRERWSLRQIPGRLAAVPLAEPHADLPVAAHAGRLCAAAPLAATAEARPALWLELLTVQARANLALHPDLAETLAAAARHVPENWHVLPEVAAAAFELVTAPDARDEVIAESANLGLFYRAFPEFQPVHGWLHHDLYHVYAVDVHSLYTLALARQLLAGRLPETPPWLAEVAGRIARPRLLLMAALLHDVGKGRGGDHSLIGARLVSAIGERIERSQHLAWSAQDTATLAWLVEHHLALSQVSQRRDLSDDETIADVAALVATRERLELLVALSVVDMRAVRPDGRDAWKEALLGQLYARTRARLDAPRASSASRRDEVRAALEQRLPDDDRLAHATAILERLPERLLAGEPVGRVVDIVRALAGLEAQDPPPLAVEVLHSAEGRAIVIVIAPDRRGLLAELAGALAVHNANIGRASVYTSDEGLAIDVFELTEPLADTTPFRDRLRACIRDALEGRTSIRQLVEQRARASRNRRRLPEVRDRIHVDANASDHSTVVEIRTRDRPALLHTIALALSEAGLDIQLSIISSEGLKVVDVFYVTRQGRKLTAEEADALVALLGERLAAASAG